MQRIIVVGTTSSGKTTLAKRISEKLQIPHIQLDELFWKPNWGETSDPEFFGKIEQATQASAWVIDGNYTRSRHISWGKADTIVWIDLPFWLTLYQNVSRSFRRAITQEELWAGTGNRESFWRMFSKESIVRWLFKTYKKNIKKYEEDMQNPKYNYLKFIRLRSHQEIDQFVSELTR